MSAADSRALIRAIRVFGSRRGMRDGEIAEAAGMHKAELSHLIHGRRKLTEKKLAALAVALGCSIDELRQEAKSISKEL